MSELLSRQTIDDSACLAAAKVETVAGLRFSTWKRLEKPSGVRISPLTAVVTAVLLLAVVISARISLEEIRVGNYQASRMFAVGLMAFMYGVPILVLIVQALLRRRDLVAATEVRSNAFPKAWAVRARGRGACYGWLTVERDLLVFRGERFDFELRASDFASSKDLPKRLKMKEGLRLKGPKGISDYKIAFYPVVMTPKGKLVAAKWPSNLEMAIEEWAGATSIGPSVLPPLSSGSTPEPITPVVISSLPLVVATSVCFGMLPFLLGTALPNQNPIALAVVGLVIGLLLPMSLVAQNAMYKSYDREAARLREGKGKES